MLVVDDNTAARDILADALRDVSESVDVVSSGAEALAAIRARDAKRPFDVVFMDWRMPEMDGLEATRRIQADATVTHAPAIVMVTAFGREEVREEAEKLEVAGFLLKPVTKSMLVDTLVSIFAPRADEAAAPAGDSERTDRLRGARILLTEDNAINQQVAVELLQGVGATVDVAGNGAEAVRKLQGVAFPPPYDVVLMDLQMPEMDGFQATAKIRSDPRFARLPIIAMTAHATIEERQRCLEAGMNDHVSKPIEPDILYATLERWAKPTAPRPSRRHPRRGARSRPKRRSVSPGVERGRAASRSGGHRRSRRRGRSRARRRQRGALSAAARAVRRTTRRLGRRDRSRAGGRRLEDRGARGAHRQGRRRQSRPQAAPRGGRRSRAHTPRRRRRRRGALGAASGPRTAGGCHPTGARGQRR